MNGEHQGAQIGMLIESNKELKSSLSEIAAGVASLMQFQAKQEERHERLEKLESRVDILWDKVIKNSLIINGAVGVVMLIVGATVTWIFKS